MKKTLLAALFFFSAGVITNLRAQDEIQQVQEEWGKEKKELVRLGMELSKGDSVKFWPVYNRYEKERQKLGKERILILQDYTDNYLDLSNAKADELIKRIFKNDAAMAKLQQQYYQTLKTTLNAKQAAKFLQVESYIAAVLKLSLQEALPFIGELDNLKKSL